MYRVRKKVLLVKKEVKVCLGLGFTRCGFFVFFGRKTHPACDIFYVKTRAGVAAQSVEMASPYL